MSSDLSTIFAQLAEALRDLTREHLLYYRVQTGRLIATRLFDGDIQTMRGQLARRDGILHAFVTAERERLDDLDLSEEKVRQCLHAWAVVQLLPGVISERLTYTHVIELAKVADDTTRHLLAEATVDQEWTRSDLRAAIDDVRAGRWPDRRPDEPGLQPVAAAPVATPPKPLAPGRVVTRFEHTADDLDALASNWREVHVAKLAPGQKRRARVALKRLKARVAQLEALLD